MSSFTLGKTATLKTITIRVKDRDKMIAFYRDMIGFGLKQEENALAIMGVKGTPAEQLWIEESPRAQPHFGEIKRMASYTMTVASLEELASIYYRLVKSDYQEMAVTFNEENIQIKLIDPEENTLIIQTKSEEGITTTQTLLEKGTKETLLAEETQVAGVHLNVPDLVQTKHFFQEVLPFDPQAFALEWTDLQGESYLTPEDEVLGLDFLTFSLQAADLLALEQHLIMKKADFYIDAKKSILTIFDPLGVEWWFTREAEK